MWWQVGLAVANALAKGNQAKNMREQQKNHNLAQAEQTRYSPWSKMGAGQLDNRYNPTETEGLVSGGIQGLGIAQGLKGLGGGEQSMWNADQSNNMKALNAQDQSNPYQFGENVYGSKRGPWSVG